MPNEIKDYRWDHWSLIYRLLLNCGFFIRLFTRIEDSYWTTLDRSMSFVDRWSEWTNGNASIFLQRSPRCATIVYSRSQFCYRSIVRSFFLSWSSNFLIWHETLKDWSAENMQMPPPPPSPSPDGGYLGIPAMSARLKALEQRILRQIGPLDPSTTTATTPPPIPTTLTTTTTTTIHRNTGRTVTAQTRQIPSNLTRAKHSAIKRAFPLLV